MSVNYRDPATGDLQRIDNGKILIDSAPTAASDRPVSSGGTYTALQSKTDLSNLATVESSTTASKAYAADDLLIYGGQLYKVISAIASGGTITISGTGQNVSATTLDANLGGNIPTAYTSNPSMDGTASPGSSTSWSKGDHVHPSDTTKMTKGVDYVTAGQASGITLGTKATAEGNNTIADGYASHAEGSNTIASGYTSHAEGSNTVASGEDSHAEGFFTKAISDYSHAEGCMTSASGDSSHAEGESTIASGNYSHAEGYQTSASGYGAHSEGYVASSGGAIIASGNGAHAEGYNTTGSTIASGKGAHAEGIATTASGEKSHAEGLKTKTSGEGSHAEGYKTSASGDYSHAEGDSTSADGYASHAENINTIASGDYSHAEGRETTASGYISHAGGNGTIAQRKSQTVIGEYNVADTAGPDTTRGNYAFIVGNGTGNNARSNAMTVDWNGGANFAGNITSPTISAITDNLGSKNLLKVTAQTQTINGVTFTVNRNAQGECTSVVLNGTCNASYTELTASNFVMLLPPGTYIASCGGTSGNASKQILEVYNAEDMSFHIARATGDTEASFTLSAYTKIKAIIRATNGLSYSNITLYPMIRPIGVPSDFVPYAPSNNAIGIAMYTDWAYNAYFNANIVAEGTVTANGSDYAENFPEASPCPVCRFVTLDGEGIRLADDGDYILGVTSEAPSMIGDKDVDGVPVGLLGKLWVEHDGSASVNGFVVCGRDGIATASDSGYRVMAVNGGKCRILVK